MKTYKGKDQKIKGAKRIMRILNPKYVKKAGMWAVTIFENNKQEIKWFNTAQKAWEFIKETKS